MIYRRTAQKDRRHIGLSVSPADTSPSWETAYVEDFPCRMTGNIGAAPLQSRRAVFVRCCTGGAHKGSPLWRFRRIPNMYRKFTAR